MKKEDQKIKISNSEFILNKNQNKDDFKTTNVNILLNRVRLDQKRTFKKRVLISFFLVTVITSVIIYFII